MDDKLVIREVKFLKEIAAFHREPVPKVVLDAGSNTDVQFFAWKNLDTINCVAGPKTRIVFDKEALHVMLAGESPSNFDYYVGRISATHVDYEVRSKGMGSYQGVAVGYTKGIAVKVYLSDYDSIPNNLSASIAEKVTRYSRKIG